MCFILIWQCRIHKQWDDQLDRSLTQAKRAFPFSYPLFISVLFNSSPMMTGFMSYFGGRKDPKQSTREAIVTLRQQLQMLEKKEEHLQKKADEELKKAKANAVTNKPGMLLTISVNTLLV